MKYLIKVLLLGYIVLFTFCQQTIKPERLFVESRKDNNDTVWQDYEVRTVDRLPAFKSQEEPSTSLYGGWKVWRKDETGFFRTEKVDGRWWIIDPQGYPYIHRAVVAFNPGSSEKQKEAFDQKYGSMKKWVETESKMLRQYGFNGTGAWTNDIQQYVDTPFVYTVIVSPMGLYRKEHIKKFGGKYEEAGWQGYRFDLAMVFDKEFDKYVKEAIEPIKKYKDDKFLLGYFADNELPWVFDALDRHLTKLGVNEEGHIAAKKWLEERKGKDSTIEDITDEDRSDFMAFYFETYIQKVHNALKEADPNHMFLGCRFNQDKNRQELNNSAIFKVAGKYMDIISINHYRLWEPNQERLDNWGEWAQKPFLITEWYTKAEDSGLPNNTGAGWLVHTQEDRGLFYQNFTLGLLQNTNCVGWHWFKYMDNDPDDLTTDPSNRDSNKGVVDRYYNPYTPLLEHMKKVNSNTYNLIQYFDDEKK